MRTGYRAGLSWLPYFGTGIVIGELPVTMHLAAGLVLVPLFDQALKLLVLHWLGRGSFPLGSMGSIRIVKAQIWLARASAPNLYFIWTAWTFSTGMLALTSFSVPSSAAFAGLLLGGSFSHACETTLRGYVCDYFCLRFWPAFNLADVAIGLGASGLAWKVLAAIAAS